MRAPLTQINMHKLFDETTVCKSGEKKSGKQKSSWEQKSWEQNFSFTKYQMVYSLNLPVLVGFLTSQARNQGDKKH